MKKKKYINVKINDELISIYKNIINKMDIDFFMEIFSNLKSKYSKFVLLLYLNSNKNLKINIGNFKQLFGINEKYNVKYFKRQILDKIEKELSNYYEEFKIEILKKEKNIFFILKINISILKNNRRKK